MISPAGLGMEVFMVEKLNYFSESTSCLEEKFSGERVEKVFKFQMR